MCAADLKNRHIGPRQISQPLKSLAFHPWIVVIDAGDLIGIGGAPTKFEYPAPAHADERGFLRQPVLPGEVGIPGVPLRNAPVDIPSSSISSSIVNSVNDPGLGSTEMYAM